MSFNLDWGEISAWAALATAIAAIVAIWTQNNSTRISLSLDLLFRLEDKFFSDGMKKMRQKAAEGLLKGELVTEALDVMDFFEEMGLLLRKKAIHEDILFESFFHVPLTYWIVGKKYLADTLKKEPEIYYNYAYLVSRHLKYAKKIGYDIRQLQDESHWTESLKTESSLL